MDQDLETEGAHFSTNAIYAGGVGLVAFGAIQFVAWGLSFPTTVELWLWRISSAVAVAVSTFGMLFHLANARVLRHLVRHNSDDGNGASSRRTRVTLVLWRALSFLKRKAFVNAWALLIYSLSRGFIVVEACRSLAFQPPGTFQTSWPANLPHIG